jgi:hypothetical protein
MEGDHIRLETFKLVSEHRGFGKAGGEAVRFVVCQCIKYVLWNM